jgi:2-polyprenyl-3-methyl-5-hydroxy-6-metoxy-1,4-benzoquinol methylase
MEQIELFVFNLNFAFFAAVSQIITYATCPCCNSSNIHEVLKTVDHTVSRQQFEIWQCNNCTLRFTQNVPSETAITSYYQSPGYVSHSNTKEGLINRLYHVVRNYTLHAKKRLIKRACEEPDSTLLDVGAGTGAFVNIMKEAGYTVTGLEPDETARKNAFQQYKVQLQTLEELFALPANSFHVITLWHVLEHVHQLHNYLDTFHAVLKNNGTLIIAVPNYTSHDAQLYGKDWAAYDVPRHLYHFSPQSMHVLMNQHKFIVKEYVPMWFDSFYISLLSEKNRNRHGNLFTAFLNGLLSNIKTYKDVKKCSSLIYIIKKDKSF